MDRSETELRVQKTFDTVAESYDHPGSFWFDLTARQIAREAELAPGAQALDVATGTGKVALALAASELSAQITGVDLSTGMLEVARKKSVVLGLHNIEYQQGSFAELSFGERFDVLTDPAMTKSLLMGESVGHSKERQSTKTRTGPT